MKTNKTTILGLFAVIAIVMGGIGFVLAQNETLTEDTVICDGTGLVGLLKGRGFWTQLSVEQRTQLTDQTREMLQDGASMEEIREMKATMLQEWGIDAPLWSGPHYGTHGSHGQMLRDGYGSDGQYGGRGSGNRSGNCYNGVCSK